MSTRPFICKKKKKKRKAAIIVIEKLPLLVAAMNVVKGSHSCLRKKEKNMGSWEQCDSGRAGSGCYQQGPAAQEDTLQAVVWAPSNPQISRLLRNHHTSSNTHARTNVPLARWCWMILWWKRRKISNFMCMFPSSFLDSIANAAVWLSRISTRKRISGTKLVRQILL